MPQKVSVEQLAFGDNVRVRPTPETSERGLAGASGQIHGVTAPSVTGVEVIGSVSEDVAFAVQIEGQDSAIWFAPDLLELVDHGAGTVLTLKGVAKKWTRTEEGSWLETSTKPRPWWRFW